MSGINSATRIMAILDVFTEDRLEWTPEELMAELGYSRPTLYRCLKTLREAGFHPWPARGGNGFPDAQIRPVGAKRSALSGPIGGGLPLFIAAGALVRRKTVMRRVRMFHP